MFAVTVWACVLPPLPLLCRMVLEGPERVAPIVEPSWRGWLSLLYTVVPVMWLGYLIWGTLLRTYPPPRWGRSRCSSPVWRWASPALLVDEPIGGLRLVGVRGAGRRSAGLFASGRRLR